MFELQIKPSESTFEQSVEQKTEWQSFLKDNYGFLNLTKESSGQEEIQLYQNLLLNFSEESLVVNDSSEGSNNGQNDQDDQNMGFLNMSFKIKKQQEKIERQFEQLYRQTRIQQLKQKALERRKRKRLFYIEKNYSTPKDVFHCFGIDIQVQFKRYQNHWGTCIVLPFKDLSEQHINKLTNNQLLALTIIENFRQDDIKPLQQFNEVLTVGCVQAFEDENYKWAYLVQQPITNRSTHYSLQKLHKMVYNVLDKATSYKTTESIVFRDFFWPGLHQFNTSQYFLYYLIQAIQQIKNKKKLKTITISCGRYQLFGYYKYWLRQIVYRFWISGYIIREEFDSSKNWEWKGYLEARDYCSTVQTFLQGKEEGQQEEYI